MSYIVVYQRSDGSSGLEECTTLDLAVVAAERLRNVDAVENPRIFKTEEVKFDFRPYYRVEVSTDDEPSTPAADPVIAAPSAPVAETPAPEALAPDLPPPPTEASEPAPPPPTAESHDTASAAPAAGDSAAIDPWAAAEGSTIDYSLDGEATAAEATAAEATSEAPAEDSPQAESPEPEVEAEDMGSSARGLFSTSSLPDPPTDASDAAQLADEVSEAVPPRRGLFGR